MCAEGCHRAGRQLELSGGHVQPREAHRVVSRSCNCVHSQCIDGRSHCYTSAEKRYATGCKKVVGTGWEEPFFGDGAGRDQTGHFALDNVPLPLRLLDALDLITDRHHDALLNELLQVRIQPVHLCECEEYNKRSRWDASDEKKIEA